MAHTRLPRRLRLAACALASAALFTSGTCHWSFHSDPDGCDPKKRPCPPKQPAQSPPALPLEAYRIAAADFSPLPEALPWQGWRLDALQGPPPLDGTCEAWGCGAHRAFAARLGAANPCLLGPWLEVSGCGAGAAGSWAMLAVGPSRSSALLEFDAAGRLASIERRW